MSGRRFGTFDTVGPESGAAHTTVVDGRLRVYSNRHIRQCRGSFSGSCYVSGSGSGSGSGSVSLSTGSSIDPSEATVARAFCLEGNNKLLVHRCDVRRESRDGVCELRNGHTVTRRGRRHIRNGTHRVLVEVPIVWV